VIAAVALLVASVLPGCWRPPVDAPITRQFVAPMCVWCPGHRGIEYRTAANAQVSAVAAGRVTFSGVVVGTRYVVVELADGRKVTYGDLAAAAVRRGDRVVVGRVIGRTTARLFLGVRVRGIPVDPLPLLCTDRGRVRLVPL